MITAKAITGDSDSYSKQHIIKTLRAWLKERMYQPRLKVLPLGEDSNAARYTAEAAKLIVLLGYYESRSFFTLCDLIASNRAAIEALVTSERAVYFENSILPILNYCSACQLDSNTMPGTMPVAKGHQE